MYIHCNKTENIVLMKKLTIFPCNLIPLRFLLFHAQSSRSSLCMFIPHINIYIWGPPFLFSSYTPPFYVFSPTLVHTINQRSQTDSLKSGYVRENILFAKQGNLTWTLEDMDPHACIVILMLRGLSLLT